MRQKDMSGRERADGVPTTAEEHLDIPFDRAPVIMHAVDKDQRIVKANRRCNAVIDLHPITTQVSDPPVAS